MSLAALLLAPVIAHGLWRPAAHVLGSSGSALNVTAASLAVALVVIVAWRLRGDRTPLFVVGAVGAVLATVALSLGRSGLLTLLVVNALIARLLPWLSPRLPAAFDGLAARHKAKTALYVVFALAALITTARLSVFIGDPTRVDMQTLPGDRFVETHSCLTAYVRASTLARQGVENLYDDRWWFGSNGLPPLPTGAAQPFPPFSLDNFSYPPPFLLIAAPLGLFDGDFLAQRALWFGLNGLLIAVSLWVVARFVDGPFAHRVLLLAPLFFGSLPILLTLQIGNFHLAAVMVSVLAMVAFERDRVATGGALLALTILSKISPGILGITLLARRRVRGAALAAAFGALLFALAALRFGWGPVESFVRYALPRLDSGRAFPFMDTESGIVTNLAPFGIPFKLRRLGFDVGDPWILAHRLGRVYTIALVALAVLGARRRGDRRDQAVGWMSLLTLAALQSPFSAAYAVIGLLWATTLLAVEVRGLLGAVGLVGLWLGVLFVMPGASTEVRAVQSMTQTVVTIAVCAWLVARAPPQPEAQAPAQCG